MVDKDALEACSSRALRRLLDRIEEGPKSQRLFCTLVTPVLSSPVGEGELGSLHPSFQVPLWGSDLSMSLNCSGRWRVHPT